MINKRVSAEALLFDFPLTTVYNEHIFEFYGGNMLGHIYEETTKYMKNERKDVRKKKGQFFTPVNIAAYMGKWTMAKEHLDILDAGAGSGILTAGIIEHLLTIDGCRSIKVTFVENDPIILPLLKKNADYIQNICENHNIIFRYTIWSDSFFAINISQKYDIVISNPPYKKIAKNSEEASLMKDYVYGQPNLYGLFMAKGLELLKKDGQYIYITPRSWVSGLYYTEVRKAILKTDIEKIHIFSDRDTVFSGEQVLQETMILFGKKEKEQIEKIEINVSSDSYMQLEKTLSVPADLIKSVGEESYLLIPTNEDDIRIIRDMSNITDTFDSLGYQFKTGPVVEFRAKEMISEEPKDGYIPMFRPSNVNGGRLKFPVYSGKAQYISGKATKLLVRNANSVFVKRLTAKEEKRRLQSCCYISKNNKEYISIENHINYLVKKDGSPLSKKEAENIHKVLSSDEYDVYFRLINGSTQVNARELNYFPLRKEEIV